MYYLIIIIQKKNLQEAQEENDRWREFNNDNVKKLNTLHKQKLEYENKLNEKDNHINELENMINEISKERDFIKKNSVEELRAQDEKKSSANRKIEKQKKCIDDLQDTIKTLQEENEYIKDNINKLHEEVYLNINIVKITNRNI